MQTFLSCRANNVLEIIWNLINQSLQKRKRTRSSKNLSNCKSETRTAHDFPLLTTHSLPVWPLRGQGLRMHLWTGRSLAFICQQNIPTCGPLDHSIYSNSHDDLSLRNSADIGWEIRENRLHLQSQAMQVFQSRQIQVSPSYLLQYLCWEKEQARSILKSTSNSFLFFLARAQKMARNSNYVPILPFLSQCIVPFKTDNEYYIILQVLRCCAYRGTIPILPPKVFRNRDQAIVATVHDQVRLPARSKRVPLARHGAIQPRRRHLEAKHLQIHLQHLPNRQQPRLPQSPTSQGRQSILGRRTRQRDARVSPGNHRDRFQCQRDHLSDF